MGTQDRDDIEQQVAEVDGVQCLQPLLVGFVDLRAFAIAVGKGLSRRNVLGREGLVLPAVDERRDVSRWPALFIDAGGINDLLEQTQLVIRVEDREVVLQADEFGVPAQHLCADRVEGAEPGHAFYHLPDDGARALDHLAGGLVREGHSEDLAGPGLARRNEVGEACCQHARLAGSGAREHEDRTVRREHGFPLVFIQAAQVGRFGGCRELGGMGLGHDSVKD